MPKGRGIGLAEDDRRRGSRYGEAPRRAKIPGYAGDYEQISGPAQETEDLRGNEYAHPKGGDANYAKFRGDVVADLRYRRSRGGRYGQFEAATYDGFVRNRRYSQYGLTEDEANQAFEDAMQFIYGSDRDMSEDRDRRGY